MPIQTSQITTEANGDLTINPAGTGKVVLTKMAGTDGERPLGAADADGNVHSFDHSQLTELPNGAEDGDLIMVQRGVDYYSVDATLLGGLPLLDPPNDTTVSFNPPPQSGSGTQTDPFVLQQVTCPTRGGFVQSVETCTVTTTANVPAFLPMYDVSAQPAKGRFDQGWKLIDDTATTSFRFDYNDNPGTAEGDGQIYDGTIKMGTTSVYVKFPVLQIANKTVFDPAANASPPSVEIPSENLYGTGVGVWADGAMTLSVTASGLGGTYDTDIEFSVNDGTMDGTPKGVSDGDTVKVIFKETSVAAASDGDTISGALTNNAGYFQPFSMVKVTQANSFTIAPLVDQPLNTEVSTGSGQATGINAPTTITGVGSSANQLTSLKVSVAGATAVAATNVTYNPGDTVLAYGTTGGVVDTTYQATFTVGGASATWDVTTTSTIPTIVQPQITSPADHSEGLAPDVTLVGSAYTAADPGNPPGPHTTSTWEVYEADLGVTCETSLIQNVALPDYPTSYYSSTSAATSIQTAAYDSGNEVPRNLGDKITGGGGFHQLTVKLDSPMSFTWGGDATGFIPDSMDQINGDIQAIGFWKSSTGLAGSWTFDSWGWHQRNDFITSRGFSTYWMIVKSGGNIFTAQEKKDNVADPTFVCDNHNNTRWWAGEPKNSPVFLTFPNDDGFDCFADGDTVQEVNSPEIGDEYKLYGHGGSTLQPWNNIKNSLTTATYGVTRAGGTVIYAEFYVPSGASFAWLATPNGQGTNSYHFLAYHNGTNWILDFKYRGNCGAPGSRKTLDGQTKSTRWAAIRTSGTVFNSYSVGDIIDGISVTDAFNTNFGYTAGEPQDIVKIVGDPDSATNKIVVDGGDWIGTDGTTSGTVPQDDKLTKFNPLAPPGAPTTEPPDATVYTAVTPSATDLTTATLDSSNLNESKAYYSRVKYADDSSTGSLVESEFSPYNEFTTDDTF